MIARMRRKPSGVPLAVLLALACCAFSLLALRDVVAIAGARLEAGDLWGVAMQGLFALAFLTMVLGAQAYLLARYGELRRATLFRENPPDDLGDDFPGPAPAVTVLVPAYREELSVVRRTLLSAALQVYPARRVVLLIDDPPHPRDASDRLALERMRQLPGVLQRSFDALSERVRASQRAFDARRTDSAHWSPGSEAEELARLLRAAADWIDGHRSDLDPDDHADRLLDQHVLAARAADCRARAAAIEQLGRTGTLALTEARAERDRLGRLAQVEFTSFERKRYANLSHELNKAMNLNAYLSLIGGHWREVGNADDAPVLVRCGPEDGTLSVPDARFVLTLDADSVLLPDYLLRLVGLMLRPGNERVAVAQTPYSAFPQSPGVLERIAGAQTDIQYLVHQGFTRFGATFWVGANALIRRSALDDIAVDCEERGHRVRKYIQDRTVIEDTESSIDLVARGWTLFNHPQRLAFSATPPDFGALLIQRRRWANGGLIILPKALGYLLRQSLPRARFAEGLLRVHYLVSVAAVNAAFLTMMFGPFEPDLLIPWVPLAMLPYVIAYAIDLRRCGYRLSDLLRIHALNLLLLPVNLGGTLKSLQQAVTGRRTPFARTPKVAGRTAADGGYLFAALLLGAASGFGALWDAVTGKWLIAAIAASHLLFVGYGIFRLIGWRAFTEDLSIWLGAAGNPGSGSPRSAGAAVDEVSRGGSS